MANVKILSDSIGTSGHRLTTIQIKLPKVLLAELGTHRVFSRNFSSSRAIPNGKMNKMESFEPLFYGTNRPGMQASKEEIPEKEEARRIWQEAIEYCKEASERLTSLGLHKQWSNRLNDWHIMAHGIVSATEWDNFFHLRCSDQAQPEMNELACMIRAARENSEPVLLNEGEWHLPYVTVKEQEVYRTHEDKYILAKISAARCCRVSYLNHEGKVTSVEEDLILFKKLSSNGHLSPLEHQATPDDRYCSHPELYGNLRGWCQFRRMDQLNEFI